MSSCHVSHTKLIALGRTTEEKKTRQFPRYPIAELVKVFFAALRCCLFNSSPFLSSIDKLLHVVAVSFDKPGNRCIYLALDGQ